MSLTGLGRYYFPSSDLFSACVQRKDPHHDVHQLDDIHILLEALVSYCEEALEVRISPISDDVSDSYLGGADGRSH